MSRCKPVQGRPLRILFSSLAVPFPPTNGHRLRNWCLVKALAADGHAVTLVAFGEPPDDLANQGLLTVCRDIEIVPNPRGSALRDRLRALPSQRPYGAVRFRSAAMEIALRRRLATGAYDVVLCDDIYNVDNVPPTSVPVLLNKHDITHVIVKRFLAYERNPLKRLYGRLEYVKLRRWEAACCARLGRVLSVSELDMAQLSAACPSAHYAYAPNVIDIHEYTPVETDDGRTILYVGAMDWPPNRDAVEFFIDRIMPEVSARVPHAEFVVAGRAPEAALRHRLGSVPRVRFTGTVPDMRAEIAKAVVCVVPLRIGSGTRLKILEAGAMEKPVVSTAIGAEGLRFEHGRDIVIADEATDFAAAIDGLFVDRARRRELGVAARRKVAAEYSVEALQQALRGALAMLVPTHGPQPVSTVRRW